MSASLYRPGDLVNLKSRSLGRVAFQGTVRIVAVQPETKGLVRYRVRLGEEAFERTIAHEDIESVATPSGNSAEQDSASGGASGWINLSAIKVRK